MPRQPLEYDVRYAAAASGASNVAVLDLRGQLDALAGEALDSAYAQASRPGLQALLLNLSEVEYINSTGITLLLGLIMRTSKAGHRLLAFGLSAHYTKIFHMTRLSDYIGLFPDQVAALSGL